LFLTFSLKTSFKYQKYRFIYKSEDMVFRPKEPELQLRDAPRYSSPEHEYFAKMKGAKIELDRGNIHKAADNFVMAACVGGITPRMEREAALTAYRLLLRIDGERAEMFRRHHLD
jgi:hypothetical protein